MLLAAPMMPVKKLGQYARLAALLAVYARV